MYRFAKVASANENVIDTWSCVILFHAMRLKINTELMQSKSQLLSPNGLRGQLCMQTCVGHGHKKSNSDANIMANNFDTFAWSHFDSLETKRTNGAFELHLLNVCH